MTVDEAAEALQEGLIVGIPTDTVYGLAVDPQDQAAMGALYELKGRPDRKPVGLLVASLEQASELVRLPPQARRMAEQYWPGPLTLVARATVVFPKWIGDHVSRSVGVRVPAHETTLSLLRRVGALAVTSANRSGEPETHSAAEAQAVFGGAIAGYVDGVCPGGAASTVIDATRRRLKIVRPGPIDL